MRIKFLAWVYALLLATIVVLAGLPGTRFIFEGVRALPGGDKTGHFLLMGMLSFVLTLAFQGRVSPLGPWRVSVGSLVALAAVTLEEFSQLFVAGRTFDVADLLCDIAGVVLFGQAALWLLKRNRASRPHR